MDEPFYPQFALPRKEVMATPPTITGITFNPANPTPGQEVTATVTYTSGTKDVTDVFTATVEGAASGLIATFNGNMTTQSPDPASSTGATDTGNHTWTKASDNGSVATWTTTA